MVVWHNNRLDRRRLKERYLTLGTTPIGGPSAVTEERNEKTQHSENRRIIQQNANEIKHTMWTVRKREGIVRWGQVNTTARFIAWLRSMAKT